MGGYVSLDTVDDLLKKVELRLTMPMMFDSTYKPDSKRVKHFCDYCMELATELFEYSFVVIPDDEVVPPGKRENRMVAWKRRTLIVLFCLSCINVVLLVF